MESLSAYPTQSRQPQPLHPLSPERVNGSRPLNSMSQKTSKSATEEAIETENSAGQSSPTRKANLFADFDPRRRSPTKESAFPPSGLPASPSLPEVYPYRGHARTNSDVQGLVKRFEHLDVRDRDAENSERRRKHELELKRAQIAREEAESDSKRLRGELRHLQSEYDESRRRERQTEKSLEVLKEKHSRDSESWESARSQYEKEVRKAKKEAFKNSSAMLKLQEDLKSMRNTCRVAQANLDMEKRKVQRKDQETFDAQFQLIALQEDLDKLRLHVKVVEEEREALKMSLKEEEVTRIAAEGLIALPSAVQDDDDFMASPTKMSPKKKPASPLSDDKENSGVIARKMIEGRRLEGELALERIRREHAEELADFLEMECRFQCCGCRSTRHTAHRSTSDSSAFNDAIENVRRTMREVFASTAQSERGGFTAPSEDEDFVMELDGKTGGRGDASAVTGGLDLSITLGGLQSSHNLGDEMAVEDDQAEPEALRTPHLVPIQTDLETQGAQSQSDSTTKVPLLPSSPQTPAQTQPATPYRQQSIRTITTTTTVPMHFTPAKPVSQEGEDKEENPPPSLSPRDRSGSAPTFDREAALAAIASRRRRAQSVANGLVTPRKQMIEGVSIVERRDISAPALGQHKVTATTYSKGASSVGRAVAGRRHA